MNDSISTAAQLIRSGELVAFPTETVYGLGADVFNERAIQKIYETKGRPSSNPLIVHIAELSDLSKLTDTVSDREQALITAFWPGPLTLIFPKKKGVPAITSGGLSTVAVRMPAHPMALELIRAAETPIAAPSANRSGKPSATHHAHVRDYFGPELCVLEGGATEHGLESTVVQIKDGVPHIYRLGSITPEDIERALSMKPVFETRSEHSPGTRFKHYSPEATLEIVESERWADLVESANKETGFMAPHELLTGLSSDIPHYDLGPAKDLPGIASHLYSALIALDQKGLKRIYVPAFVEEGLGLALMDRLRRAAGQE